MDSSNTICSQCGIPLAPNATFCSNCGTRYTEQTVVRPSQHTPLADQAPPGMETAHFEPIQYIGSSSPLSYGNSPFDSTSHGSTGQNQSLQPSSDTNNTSFSPVEAPQPRSGSPNIRLIIGIIFLVLVVIGGGIFFVLKSTGSNTNVTSNGSTSSTTHSATATPTPTPLFADNFADNSKGWGLASSSGYSSTISNNIMILAEANHKILDMTIPASNNVSATYGDFEVTTTLTLLKADQNDSVGLYIRGDSNLSQGYFIDIFGDNSFDIVKIFADSNKDTFLVSPTSSSTINPVGRKNKLTVVAKGAKLVVLINDKVVSSINDSNGYTNGTIALFVENGQSSNGVQASFNNIIVYPAPVRLPVQ
jgi:zinc-ribbon domain/Domain of Unknown Function (DUF1080)